MRTTVRLIGHISTVVVCIADPGGRNTACVVTRELIGWTRGPCSYTQTHTLHLPVRTYTRTCFQLPFFHVYISNLKDRGNCCRHVA